MSEKLQYVKNTEDETSIMILIENNFVFWSLRIWY